MAPIGSANANADGSVSAANISYYKAIAAGGTGLIVVESTYPDNICSKGEDGELSAADNEKTTGLAVLAQVIHDHFGTKCAIQLCHIGQQLSLKDRMDSWGPSDMEINYGGVPQQFKGMSVDQIKQLEEDFATAAWRAKIAGFDAVEVHASGGHLHNLFLSPLFNKRTDEYGGSIENRSRIVIETVKAVQQRCGKNFPILVRVCGDEFEEGGLTMEDSAAMCRMLDDLGIAAIDMNAGSSSNGQLCPTMYYPRALHVPVAEGFKKLGVRTPIIIAGSINSPELAEKILAEGKADFIGLARPLLADPNWVNKLKAGNPEDIVPCIRCCMGCVGTMEEFNASRGLRCSVNPLCNLGLYRSVAPLKEKKRVGIIGGGPGGMEAARLAALRGHDVTLYEKRELGGAMIEANFDPTLKADIGLLIDYYKAQMNKLPINIIREEASADKILHENFDAVIVATGAHSRGTKVPGHDRSNVFTDIEVTGGKDADLGQRVVVVGGGVIAAEIAVSQAMKGKQVALTTRRGAKMGMLEIAADDSSPGWITIIRMLMQYKIDIHLCLTLKEITEKGITAADPDGNITAVEADSVVICGGFDPNNELYAELKDKVGELYLIGDAVKARLIGDAVHEGWIVANQL
jgi:NADH:flavin oxidoreductases, Old Yellow Enzyme family